MEPYVILLIIAAIFILVRLIFRVKTKNYESIMGEIVDFKTEEHIFRKKTYYIHSPIIEFNVDGKAYRCVKQSLYHSRSSSWEHSLVAKSFGESAKVRYNPNSPKNNYPLYSLKDYKYNVIEFIPAIVVLIIFMIILSLYDI